MTADRERLFVGFGIPSALLDALDPVVSSLASTYRDGRFVDRANHHVTLKFLGWLPPPEVEGALDMCSRVASSHGAFPLAFTGLGAFPSLRRARVLWVGIDDRSGSCSSLATDLDRRAVDLGVSQEDRDFSPHLTLARFKRPRPIADVPPLPPSATEAFEIDELVLYRSHVSSKGARYEVRERFPLGSDAQGLRGRQQE